MATVNLSSIITPANIVTASGTETLTNKTINIASNTLTGVQPTLVSGTSIKTINSTSLLGSGNIALSSGLTLLSTVTASNSATVDIETTFNSTYDKYVIEATNITLATNGQELYGRMKVGGTYATSGYLWRLDRSLSSGSDTAFAQRTTTSSGDGTIFDVCSAISNAAGMSADFTMHISNPAGTTNQKMVYWEGVSNTGSAASNATGQALNTATTALTGIRFLTSGGNILTGTFRLYGIANS